MLKVLAIHEARMLCRSPFAWIAAGLLQLMFGWMFLAAVEQYLIIQPGLLQQPQTPGVTGYLTSHWLAPVSTVFLIATPLLCMNLIAAERQSGRYALLASAPISAGQIAVGKFLGASAFQWLVLSINMALAATLTFATSLDTPQLLCAWLGMALFIAAATAISLFFSSLTTRPALAAFCSSICLLMLWLTASASAISSAGKPGLLMQLSPATHLQHFMHGRLQTDAIVYFAVLTGIFLVLSVRQLDALRQPR